MTEKWLEEAKALAHAECSNAATGWVSFCDHLNRVIDSLHAAGHLATPAMRQAAEACAYFKQHSGDNQRQAALDSVWIAGAAVLAEREASKPKPRWKWAGDCATLIGRLEEHGRLVTVTRIDMPSEAHAAAAADALNKLEDA
jgi:hypothetical protein